MNGTKDRAKREQSSAQVSATVVKRMFSSPAGDGNQPVPMEAVSAAPLRGKFPRLTVYA
jgi:hypothetical protein